MDAIERLLLAERKIDFFRRARELDSLISDAEQWLSTLTAAVCRRPGATRRAVVALAQAQKLAIKAEDAGRAGDCTAGDAYLMLASVHIGQWFALRDVSADRRRSGAIRTPATVERLEKLEHQIKAMAGDTSRTASGLGALRAGAVGLAPDTLARKIRKVRRPA